MSPAVQFLLALSFLCNAGAYDPVRRSSKAHCVAWGDGPYFGMKFADEKQADQQFQRMKKDELAIIHYDHRFREVQRHQSPRLKLVKWQRLADWCKEDHKVEEQSLDTFELGVGAAGKVSHASLLSSDEVPLSSQEPHETVDEVGLKASSSLVGTVTMIEKEVAGLVSKTSSLLAIIGQTDFVSTMLGKVTEGTLKTRVNSLDLVVYEIFRSTEMLEKNLLGVVETGSVKSQSSKGNPSIKNKVESLLAKVSDLKKRIPALEASPVLSAISQVEGKVAHIVTQTASMLKGLGMSESHAVSAIQTNAPLSARLLSLEEMLTNAQHDVKALEAEVLEHSSSDSEKPLKMDAPVKIKIDAMSAMVEDLSGRLKTLESSSLQDVVDQFEGKVALLQSKTMELSKRVGSEANLSNDSTRTSSIKKRIPVLTDRVSKVQAKLDSLEEELLGATKNLHASLGESQSMRGQVTALEAKVDALMTRATTLEQEV